MARRNRSRHRPNARTVDPSSIYSATNPPAVPLSAIPQPTQPTMVLVTWSRPVSLGNPPIGFAEISSLNHGNTTQPAPHVVAFHFDGTPSDVDVLQLARTDELKDDLGRTVPQSTVNVYNPS